ncbi:hypothetical protein B0H16DRAFT_1686239 [Mycena metata]|uniref:Nephrocystin 3-like N-terminal domain-containing protein n=1 Tax=Mycena metata TaxID=1033252 RepID=A0AAD7NPE7_9AGAR|nr:hypothetical protein B0H16DRAFT_1686239 [Mycena metata]
MPPGPPNGSNGRESSPETIGIVAVCMSPDVPGFLTCNLQLPADGSIVLDSVTLESKTPKKVLHIPVVIRRNAELVVACTHRRAAWTKTTFDTEKFAFSEILSQLVAASPGGLPSDADLNVTLRLELGDTPQVLKHVFKLKPKLGPTVQISMAKVNSPLSGRGFHYIGFRVDGSMMFERRLTSTPYPQEYPLFPEFSFHPEMELRLCLFRRPYYIWPLKHILKSSPLTAEEAHNLLSAAPGVIEHTFLDIPVTVRLQLQNSAAILDQSAKIISRRTHILERLGTSRTLMENIVKCASSASEMHPIAKSVVEGLGYIYNTLAKLEDWDDKLLDLIDDMTSFLAYIDHIESFTTMDHFQKTLKALHPFIQRTGNLVLKFPQHGLSALSEMEEYESLRRTFERWTRRFSQDVGVETLKGVGMVQNMMKDQREFFRKNRRDILDQIRPTGTDRMRPIPGCLGGTRKRIFDQIDAWLDDRNSPNILWIKGSPGSGKSCIARSVVEKLSKTDGFGSSFFFERDNGGFTAPSTMLRTISTDLCRYPVFKDALLTDLGKRMVNFSTTGIEEQFHRLIETPLQCLHEAGNENAVIVVVDALDECGGLGASRQQDRSDVLAAIKRWATFSPSLRLVVTSRDETSIFEVLDPISTSLKLRLDSSHATKDIEAYLGLELRKIGTSHSLPDWPSQTDVQALSAMARGLFVWAATLVKFVDQPKPQNILQQILSGNANVEGPIDDLYKLILHISFCANHQPNSAFLAEFKAFVGAIITANRPLAKESPLFKIINVEMSTATYICGQLRSVMIPDKPYLRFNHQSVVDFLLSAKCPAAFRINSSTSRRKISLAIFHLLDHGLHFDLSKIRTSYRPNPSNIAGISEELAFACRAWGEILSAFEIGRGGEHVMAALKSFLEAKFLCWLEVLSLTNQMSCALPQLLDAKKMIGIHDPLAVFVADAITFVEIFGDCISKSAAHVYLSAMAFTPESSKIHQTYAPSFRPCASLVVQIAEALRNGRSAIPAPIIYVPSGNEAALAGEGHVDDILSVLFIQDGYIASASHDATIRFWDPTLGAPILMPFIHHEKPVTSLAFSQDRMLLVSGSRDGCVGIWDMNRHEILATFSLTEAVTCVAISPSGKTIVAGCKDGTVNFWDIRRREEPRSTFREHKQRVTAVAFLDDENAVQMIFIHPQFAPSRALVRAEKRLHALAVSVNRRSLIAACCSCIVVWTLSDSLVAGDPVYLAKDSYELRSIAVHGSRIAAGVGNKIQIWDSQSGELVMGPFNDHRDLVTSLAFSSNGKWLVSGSIDRSIRVWNTGSGDEISLGGFPDGSTIESSGWIRGPEPKRNLILWVPESQRRLGLCWGRTIAVMDGKPSAYLTLSENLIGKRWYKCRV